MRRSIRPLVAAAMCLAAVSGSGAIALGPTGDDLAACPAEGQVVMRKDHWIEIKAPKFDAGEGPRTIVDYATPPNAKSRIFMTNGRVVKISTNSGCTWKTAFDGELAKLDAERVPSAAQDVFTHVAAPNDNSAWAASYDTAGGVVHPHVYVASGLDNEENLADPQFVDANVGMPPVGMPVALVGSPSRGSVDVMYLVIELPAPDPSSGDVETPARQVYVTDFPDEVPPAAAVMSPVDLAWKSVPLPEGFSHVQGVAPMAAGRGVWLWSGTKYASTLDTTADSVEWTTGQVAGRITAINVNRVGITTIAMEAPQGGALHTLGSEGFVEKPVPTAPAVIAHGRRMDVYVIGGQNGTFGYDLAVQRWVDITPKGVGPFVQVQMPNGQQGGFVLGRSGNSLYRFDLYPGDRFLPPKERLDGNGGWPDLPTSGNLTAPKLTPMRQTVVIKPGEKRQVPVTFEVPADTTPLDVFFLIDTTASMDIAIAGLRESMKNIALRLRKALGKDACFGLGEFRDFIQKDPQHTYVRRLPITCEGEDVPRIRDELDKLDAQDGGDQPEAQTLALQQAVTGKGYTQPPYVMLPGQDAKFRPGSFKVIVLISDSEFHQGGNYPTIDDTVTSLNAADVKVVSLVTIGNGRPETARRDMEKLAKGTDTYAPKGGVDCDGDGQWTGFDINGGDPLVCDTSGTDPNIGPAIVGLLLGVVDPGTLAVEVHDDHNVVNGTIRGETSEIRNLKQRNALSFVLPVQCSKAQDGKDLPVGLVPTVRAKPVGLYGEVVVQCRAEPPPPPPPPPVEPELVPEFPRPPKPPVALALPQPPPAPAQPISNINLNAGFSQQEEQQFQLAAVTQGAGEEQAEEEAIELAMSDYRTRNAGAAGLMLGGAVVMSAAAAVAYRRRLQRSTNVSYVRSSR